MKNLSKYETLTLESPAECNPANNPFMQQRKPKRKDIKLIIETFSHWVEVFNIVWREGVAPSDWKNAVIVPVYKKGSRLDCTNYRGISLMSVVGKVFARVLNER